MKVKMRKKCRINVYSNYNEIRNNSVINFRKKYLFNLYTLAVLGSWIFCKMNWNHFVQSLDEIDKYNYIWLFCTLCSTSTCYSQRRINRGKLISRSPRASVLTLIGFLHVTNIEIKDLPQKLIRAKNLRCV